MDKSKIIQYFNQKIGRNPTINEYAIIYQTENPKQLIDDFSTSKHHNIGDIAPVPSTQLSPSTSPSQPKGIRKVFQKLNEFRERGREHTRKKMRKHLKL